MDRQDDLDSLVSSGLPPALSPRRASSIAASGLAGHPGQPSVFRNRQGLQYDQCRLITAPSVDQKMSSRRDTPILLPRTKARCFAKTATGRGLKKNSRRSRISGTGAFGGSGRFPHSWQSEFICAFPCRTLFEPSYVLQSMPCLAQSPCGGGTVKEYFHRTFGRRARN